MVELHRQHLVLSTRDTTTRELLEEWFRSVNAEPVVVVEMNPIAPMLALVRRLDVARVPAGDVIPGRGAEPFGSRRPPSVIPRLQRAVSAAAQTRRAATRTG